MVAGPSTVLVALIQKDGDIYNEKFLAKLGDLRSNGLSVYKLPWFVLVGEPL